MHVEPIVKFDPIHDNFGLKIKRFEKIKETANDDLPSFHKLKNYYVRLMWAGCRFGKTIVLIEFDFDSIEIGYC